MVGGFGSNGLPSVELLHPCFIPDLPQARSGHSLSLLSGGRLVVCGGWDGNSCISWVAGNTSWTHFYTMRCLPMIMDEPSSLLFGFVSHSVFSMCQTQKIIICHNHHLYQTQSQRGESCSHGLDAAFSSRLHRPPRRPHGSRCNISHCRDCSR